MTNRRIFLTGIGAAAMAAIGFVPAPALALSGDEAKAHVEAVVEEVLALVRSDGSTGEKADRLGTVMEKRAAMPQIARFAAGRAWRDMSEAQQDRYVPAFTRFVSTMYARRFQDYSGETVTVLDAVDAGKKGFLVKSSVTQAGGAPVNVEWLITDRPGRTVLADIIIEGISLLTTQREEISGMLESRGGDLEKLIADLEASGSSS
ncbi:MAG: ABC transporter substrate-binding protein [Pseudomonadota bacterium]